MDSGACRRLYTRFKMIRLAVCWE